MLHRSRTVKEAEHSDGVNTEKTKSEDRKDRVR